MTNQLFRDLLENKIPGHETPTTVWVDIMPQIPPRFYFLPTLADPKAPTVAELNAGIDLSRVVTIDGYSPTPWPHMTPEAAIREEKYQAMIDDLQQMAAVPGMSVEEIMDLLAKAGAAPKKERIPKYVMPAPPYPTGNIATQKRRRKL